MLNYDPDAKPNMPEELPDQARKLGLHVIHIICDESNARLVTTRAFRSLQ